MSPPDAGSQLARIASALDAAGIGTWEWNLDAQRVHWSPTAERLHGYEPGGLGETFDVYEKHIDERDRDRVLAAVRQAAAEGSGFSLKYRMERPDRVLQWIASYGRVDSSGTERILVAASMEITARRQRERELAVQRGVSEVLSRPSELREISSRLLQVLGEALEWDFGELWLVPGDASELDLIDTWSRDPEIGRQFIARTKEIQFRRGVGIPGRVWEGAAVWERDISSDPSIPRREIAEKLGLRSVVGFPISFGSTVLGVLVFYARHIEEIDTELKRLLTFIGAEVGQYVERQNAIEQLQASEDRFRGLAESAADAILTVDHRGLVLFANRAVEEIFGYPRKEVLGRSLSSLMPERFRERHEQGFARYMNTGVKKIPWTGIELPGLRKDGTEVSLEIAFSEFTSGGQRFVTGVARDIGARKREADALKFLSDASTAFAETLDRDKTLRALAGLTVPRLADWCIVDLLDEEGAFRTAIIEHRDPEMVRHAHELRERFPASLDSPHGPANVLRTGKPEVARIDPELLRASATTEEHLAKLEVFRFASYLCLPLVARGRTLGTITLATAESARVFDEFDLTLGQELAARVSVALDNARLYRNSQEAIRAKDEFLAQLSHELRTPITAVLGYARLLEEGGLTPQDIELAIDSIKKSAEAQARLVEDLLDVSRGIMGKFRLDVSPLDLSQVAGASVDAIRPAAGAKNITVNVTGDCNACLVVGDPNRLRQVAWNLLSNAIKFTPAGGAVTVNVGRAGSDVILEVSDNGIGIPPEFLPHVFERFAQGVGAPQLGGLGLGLAIVKHLVELHGGTIEAVSDGEGRGSTFRVRFPSLPSTQEAGEQGLTG